MRAPPRTPPASSRLLNESGKRDAGRAYGRACARNAGSIAETPMSSRMIVPAGVRSKTRRIAFSLSGANCGDGATKSAGGATEHGRLQRAGGQAVARERKPRRDVVGVDHFDAEVDRGGVLLVLFGVGLLRRARFGLGGILLRGIARGLARARLRIRRSDREIARRLPIDAERARE